RRPPGSGASGTHLACSPGSADLRTPRARRRSLATADGGRAHELHGKVEPVAAEQDLAQERLIRVLRQVPAFVAVLRGPDHVFEVANPEYQKLIDHREAIGRPVREVLPEIEHHGFIELLDRVYRTGVPYVGTEQPILMSVPGAPAQKRYLNLVYQPDIAHSGEIVGVIVHGVDVTEQGEARRTAERQAEELQAQATRLEEAQSNLEAAYQRLAAASSDAEDARARLEAVIQQMPSGVVIADATDGRLLLANQQVE